MNLGGSCMRNEGTFNEKFNKFYNECHAVDLIFDCIHIHMKRINPTFDHLP
jgi:hypothetical protein